MSDSYSWHPATSAQKAALDSMADILLFGGSAGSLKTETLLMDAAQEVSNKNLNAIIFRASFTQMSDLVRKTRRLYTPLGGTFNGSTHVWKFPSGAVIRFAYIKNDDDVWNYLGPEYSFIGFDESTLHTEFQVRNILGRLRSTDPTLRLRVRLTSNPGNVGASWHIPLFLRGFCPVHFPEKSAQPGKLYRDCKWPSDDKPITMSIAFIPGKLTDHSLLGPDYIKNLEMMSGANAEAMATGCWDALEGAYFPFLTESYKKPYGESGVEWWHNHFLSLDYGYGKSSSSVGLYVRGPGEVATPQHSIPGIRKDSLLQVQGQVFPAGRIRKVGEIVVPHVPAYELAKMVVDRFIAPDENGQRRRIVGAYLDPSNYKEIGDGHTIADQINEIFEPWDVACEMASNDRPGGWQLLYKMLRTGEFEILDTCPKTFESLRTRMHDDKRPGDIRKVAGDPLDDVADETRYALYTFTQKAELPKEMRVAMAISGIDRSTREGMTSSALRYQQMAEVLEAEEAPVQLTRFSPSRFRRR